LIPTRLQTFLGLGGYPAVLRRDPAAVPVLLDLLMDENSQVQWAALLCLSETPILPAGVPQAILPLLGQDHAELRSFAAQRLTTICSDETILVPAFLPLLKDDNVGVRRSIVYTLAPFGIKSPEVLVALCQRLGDRSEHASVRCSAARALSSLGKAAQPAVPVLREALADADGEVRVTAATALWRITGQAAPGLSIVLQALQHPDVRIRKEAAQSLWSFSPDVPGVVPALVQALQDPDPSVRWPACSTLADIRWACREEVRDVIPALIRLVQGEKHNATLRAAIRALGHIGPQAASAVPSLTKVLERPDQSLRAQVADALGAMGSAAKEAVPALLDAYHRGTAPFLDRQAVLTALHRIDPETAARNKIP
jgi:HEAT repeat protein